MIFARHERYHTFECAERCPRGIGIRFLTLDLRCLFGYPWPPTWSGARHDAHPESRSEARAPHVARGRRQRGAANEAAAAEAASCERGGGAATAESAAGAHRE